MSRWQWIALTSVMAAGNTVFGQSSAIPERTINTDAFVVDKGTYVRRTRIVQPFSANRGRLRFNTVPTELRRNGDLFGSTYLLDTETNVHYGYSFSIEALGNNEYRFSILPFDTKALVTQGSIFSIPNRAPELVRAGSAFAVDLYRGRNERVYDRYEIISSSVAPPSGGSTNITFAHPELYINEARILASLGIVSLTGDRVFIRVPRRGEYILALTPEGNDGFLPAGYTLGNTLIFDVDGDRFKVVSAKRIANGGDTLVYVYRNPDPSVPSFVIGAGGGRPRTSTAQ